MTERKNTPPPPPSPNLGDLWIFQDHNTDGKQQSVSPLQLASTLCNEIEGRWKPSIGEHKLKSLPPQPQPQPQPPSLGQDAKERGEASATATQPQAAASHVNEEYVSVEDVPPSAHDEIWGFMLATIDMMPVHIAEELMQIGPLRLVKPLMFHTEGIARRMASYEDSIIALRRKSIQEQKLDADNFEHRLDRNHVRFAQCCYATASINEIQQVENLHNEQVLASLMGAVVDRTEAQHIKMNPTRGNCLEMFEDTMRALRHPSIGVMRDGLLCDRDAYGNISTTNPDVGYVYKPRGELLADLESDIKTVNNLIVYERNTSLLCQVELTEVFRLYFQRARILEMKAVVHDQNHFSSPRLRPRRTTTKPHSLRLSQEREWLLEDKRIRDMCHSGKLPQRDASHTVEKCVKDQLHVMCYLTRFLVPRYHLISDYLTSEYFASLPEQVIEEHTQRLLLVAGGCGEADQDTRCGVDEAKWNNWYQPREVFATYADNERFVVNFTEFLLKLAKYNRFIVKLLPLHRHLSNEFAALPQIARFKNSVTAPMALQLRFFEAQCTWHLLQKLATSENKCIKSLAEQTMKRDEQQQLNHKKKIKDCWDALPLVVADMLPPSPLDLTTATAGYAWGQTARTRGHRFYTDYTRAHLQLQSSAEAKAYRNCPVAAYRALVHETSSPTWFARHRKKEMEPLLDAGQLCEFNLATDAKQRSYLVTLVKAMLTLEKERNRLMQDRLDMHAKLLQLLVHHPNRVRQKNDRTSIIKLLLDGMLFPIEGEWRMKHIPKDMQSSLEATCNVICSYNRQLALRARRYREHARQLSFPMQLDPVTIRYSIASVQMRMSMSSRRAKELQSNTAFTKQYNDLVSGKLPLLGKQLKQNLAVWRQLPDHFKQGQSAGCSIVFNLDPAVYKWLLLCGM